MRFYCATIVCYKPTQGERLLKLSGAVSIESLPQKARIEIFLWVLVQYKWENREMTKRDWQKPKHQWMVIFKWSPVKPQLSNANKWSLNNLHCISISGCFSTNIWPGTTIRVQKRVTENSWQWETKIGRGLLFWEIINLNSILIVSYRTLKGSIFCTTYSEPHTKYSSTHLDNASGLQTE